MNRARRIAIAGAGIAGLTSALTLAVRGFSVELFERSPKVEEVGAGLQLSPNATHILRRLGVLSRLNDLAVRPQAIELRRANSLRKVASVPLGDAAQQRWGAPYLTVHRADLQQALLAAVNANPSIALNTGMLVSSYAPGGRINLTSQSGDEVRRDDFDLIVAADGVWSTLRKQIGGAEAGQYSGYLAWRAVVDRSTSPDIWKPAADRVTTLLSPHFHLVAYPLRCGELINLVVLAKGPPSAERWANVGNPEELTQLMRGADSRVLELIRSAGPWTTWPLHQVRPDGEWISPDGVVLVGDAAHAMTPFAAQGAAMAIEDAAVLADMLARHPQDRMTALRAFKAARIPRVLHAARRGAFNRFAWNAAGPIALGRDIVLSLRPPQSLAADMDWLYGWKEPAL